MTDISIEKALPSDINKLTGLSIRSKAYWNYSDDFIQNCMQEFTVTADDINRSGLYYTAMDFDKTVGFYGLAKLSHTVFELDRLYVDPVHIGKGIGRILIEHAIENVSRLDGHELIVQSDPHAREFYEAVGGVMYGEKESGSIPGRFLPMLKFTL